MKRIFLLVFITSIYGCEKSSSPAAGWNTELCMDTKGILIGTRFISLDALSKCIDIEYKSGLYSKVKINHCSSGREVESNLRPGVSEKDFEQAKAGSFKDKVLLAIKSPYAIICREDLISIMLLARKDGVMFGEGDKSFFDLAKAMTLRIDQKSIDTTYLSDSSEKGFLNSFNHLTAQAFITTLFSERTADYVADLHEIARIPELITGRFSEAQLEDLDNGPVDNYVDLINNEWGQELGKKLKKKYELKRNTTWSPKLLTTYLNEIQSYCSWSLRLSMTPFTEEDEIVLKFSKKLNNVMNGTV